MHESGQESAIFGARRKVPKLSGDKKIVQVGDLITLFIFKKETSQVVFHAQYGMRERKLEFSGFHILPISPLGSSLSLFFFSPLNPYHHN